MSRGHFMLLFLLLIVNMCLTYLFYTSWSNKEHPKTLSHSFSLATDPADGQSLPKSINSDLGTFYKGLATAERRNVKVDIYKSADSEVIKLKEIRVDPLRLTGSHILEYPINPSSYDRARRKHKRDQQLYDFIIKPSHDIYSDKGPDVIIAVCSDVQNFEQRRAIRETWASPYVKPVKVMSRRDIARKENQHSVIEGSVNGNHITTNSWSQPSKSPTSPSPPRSVISDTVSSSEVDDLGPPDSDRRIRYDEPEDTSTLPVSLYASVETFPEHPEALNQNSLPLSARPLNIQHSSAPVKNYATLFHSNVTDAGDNKAKTNLEENKIKLNNQQPARTNYSDESTRDDRISSIRVLFILARPDEQHSNLQKYVDDEYAQYGDVIQSDFIDSYANLTLKTLSAMRWTLENCPSARFLFKTDDDVYVGIENLLDLLNTSVDNDDVIIGHVMHGAEPVRDRTSHHYTPWTVYREKVFPAYASGSGYVMSVSAVRKIYHSSLQRRRFFWLEDVYITGLVAKHLSIPLVHDARFHFRREMHGARGACWYSDVITEHRLDAEYLRWLWIALLELNYSKDSNKTEFKCSLSN